MLDGLLQIRRAGRHRLTWLGVACVALGLAALLTGCGSQARTPRRGLASRYMVIARAGNRRLEKDFDPLEGRDRNHLAAAKADLSDAAKTERLFDRRLLRIKFPGDTERVARDLYRINQARARLTVAAAASSTLPGLHAYEPALDAANGPVEQAVKTIRRQLGLPPPSTS